MKAGQVRVVSSPVIKARTNTGLSQLQFAALLSVSVRILQGWEQGRKPPSGAACTLLAIAGTTPKAELAVADKQCLAQKTPSPSIKGMPKTLHQSGAFMLGRDAFES